MSLECGALLPPNTLYRYSPPNDVPSIPAASLLFFMRALRPLWPRHALVSPPVSSSFVCLSAPRTVWITASPTPLWNPRSFASTPPRASSSTSTSRSVLFSTTSSPFARRNAKMAPYEEVLKGKYPGKTHVKKVVGHIQSQLPNATGVIYVEAKKAKLHEDCDQEEHFR